jgi:hypothetical protein
VTGILVGCFISMPSKCTFTDDSLWLLFYYIIGFDAGVLVPCEAHVMSQSYVLLIHSIRCYQQLKAYGTILHVLIQYSRCLAESNS